MHMFDLLILMVLIIFGLGVLLFFVNVTFMERACEDDGGEINSNLDCRKGNEFYEIYPANRWNQFKFDYVVNKYQKTER